MRYVAVSICLLAASCAYGVIISAAYFVMRAVGAPDVVALFTVPLLVLSGSLAATWYIEQLRG